MYKTFSDRLAPANPVSTLDIVTPSAWGKQVEDRVDDIIDRQATGVNHDGATCFDQWAISTRRIFSVAFDNRGLDIVDIATDLRNTPLGSHTR
jgi:hypothetical protein